MSQWVQHISGEGKKWEVKETYKAADGDIGLEMWRVYWPNSGGMFALPATEYRLCDPPEVWENVTEYCLVYIDSVDDGRTFPTISYQNDRLSTKKGLRLRKVDVNFVGSGIPNGCAKGTAFIVERKKP